MNIVQYIIISFFHDNVHLISYIPVFNVWSAMHDHLLFIKLSLNFILILFSQKTIFRENEGGWPIKLVEVLLLYEL